ncbi:hypothetical protein NW767_015630 [Fusarium falciforme]|nr:hypothetical protein NW767_015630 [Fusarium falciforme]
MPVPDKTGRTPYFDEAAAAARYMVYDGHSWISFDDAETFQMKIDYARKMGLHGLMIWAIDLDTPNLEALRAISKGELIGHTQAPFSLVDLERVFAAEMLPPEDAETNYALINFGGNADAGETDPNQTCFGFVLVTGDSHAVSSLKKREDEPEPLVFLDCPPDVLERPKNETQTATVVCLSEDVEDASGSWREVLRALLLRCPIMWVEHFKLLRSQLLSPSHFLKESEDQSVPSVHSPGAATSKVFDFAFDMNLNRTQQDAGNTKIHIDYSNSGDALSHRIAKRFFAERQADWRTMCKNAETHKNEGKRHLDEEVDTPFFRDSEFDGEDYELGFGAHVGGKFKADLTYSFSMISDLTFSVGGIGVVDFDKARKGNPASTQTKPINLKGHTLQPTDETWMTLQPYYKTDYMLESLNDTDASAASPSAPYFDGKLSTCIKSDWEASTSTFRPTRRTSWAPGTSSATTTGSPWITTTSFTTPGATAAGLS